MKKIRQLILFSALLGAALLPFRASAQTYQTTDYTNSFPNNGNTGLYQAPSAIYWYSIYHDYNTNVGYNLPMTNDAAVDAGGDTNDSGSLYVYTPFNSTSNHDQNVFYFDFADDRTYDNSLQIPILLVTNISFQIHVDPHSKPDPDGNFGTITVGLITSLYNSGANSSYYQPLTIPGAATNGWVTLAETNTADEVNEVNGYGTGNTDAFGVDFDYNNYGGLPTNPVGFWIDNVILLTSAAPPPPPPPPVLSISPPLAPGLNLFAGTSTSLYQREDLETVNPDYSWVNAGKPVSFSFTISDYPIGKNDNFQTQIFLVPNPGTETAPDYGEPNLVFFDLESTTNGTSWLFRYKTNEPNGNTMVYGSGTLATVNSSLAAGTYTATFNNNSNITMTTPSGTSTNFSIPDSTGATAALFASGVKLYFGVQAGNLAATADHITVSDFSVTGLGANDFNDNFVTDAGALNQSLWETNANYGPAVQLVTPGDPTFLVSWTSPALNYNLLVSTNLNSTNNWQPYLVGGLTLIPTRLGSNYNQIVDTNGIPPSNAAFFELVQPGQ